MTYLITGDTHGRVLDRLKNIDETIYPKDETAFIILGDAGLNFWLNEKDKEIKKEVNDYGYTIYCVRGNHEERPENIPTMKVWQDNEIMGPVRIESEFPNIRYLVDGWEYWFNGHSTLVIGGAYSVDKYARISKFDPNTQWTGWFKDEQLTKEEMKTISDCYNGEPFDFVLSHTCPYSWMPTDLFLGGINQSTVDNTMEKWLDELKDSMTWVIWLFGHYHDDRLVRPGVEMYFNDIEDMDTIWNRWVKNENPEWWIKKDPNYYLN